MPQRVNMVGENCFKMSKKMKEVVSNIIENVSTSQEQNMDEDMEQLGSAGGIFRKPQRIRVRDTVLEAVNINGEVPSGVFIVLGPCGLSSSYFVERCFLVVMGL
jgi:hypothetical protein